MNTENTKHTSKLPVNLHVQKNTNGRPLVAEWFGGSYGFSGSYLREDGRIHVPARNGGYSRDVNSRDRLFTADGAFKIIKKCTPQKLALSL